MSESMIGQSAERLFSNNVDKKLLERFEAGQWPTALWNLTADSGFGIALAAEDRGGIGASWSEAYPILRGVGYWQAPLPLAETMIATLLLSLAGIDLPDGPVALIEEGTLNRIALREAAGGSRLHGQAQRVAWAGHCRWALVALAGGRLAVIDLTDTATARLTRRSDHAGEPCDTVDLDAAPCLALFDSPLPALALPLRTLGAIARSAMMVGALERLLEESVRYAGDRVQFGRPIGRNQAIQQSLALLAGDVCSARVAALVACADAPSSQNRDCSATEFSGAVAKIRVGEAATRGTSIAHQVHGAIGFTHEHSLQFATRRLWAWREAHGSDAWWAQRLGEQAIAARGTGFWPAMTTRRFEPSPLPPT
ncbi:MAG: acyl-CoA dehydrogenase [Burkholderiales bacterium]|nr:acyl-CoA dehydrogenase [Burkholderiales bacterium]